MSLIVYNPFFSDAYFIWILVHNASVVIQFSRIHVDVRTAAKLEAVVAKIYCLHQVKLYMGWNCKRWFASIICWLLRNRTPMRRPSDANKRWRWWESCLIIFWHHKILHWVHSMIYYKCEQRMKFSTDSSYETYTKAAPIMTHHQAQPKLHLRTAST